MLLLFLEQDAANRSAMPTIYRTHATLVLILHKVVFLNRVHDPARGDRQVAGPLESAKDLHAKKPPPLLCLQSA